MKETVYAYQAAECSAFAKSVSRHAAHASLMQWPHLSAAMSQAPAANLGLAASSHAAFATRERETVQRKLRGPIDQ